MREAADDAELLRRARTGSRQAIDALLERCSPMLEAYLQGRSGARLRRFTSISDLRQEVLLRGVDALRLLPEAATLEDFQSLLKRHAQWVVASAARRTHRVEGESLAPPGRADAPPGRSASEGEVTREDERRWLARQVEELDEPLAAVCRLRLAGLTFAEMARELGIGEDAARKRLVRASVVLRQRRDGG